jgi:hypothetical protein
VTAGDRPEFEPAPGGVLASVWDRGSLSRQDAASVAARDVSRLLAASPALRRLVELADRETPHNERPPDRAENHDDRAAGPVTILACPAVRA